jgi:hypothetical protein
MSAPAPSIWGSLLGVRNAVAGKAKEYHNSAKSNPTYAAASQAASATGAAAAGLAARAKAERNQFLSTTPEGQQVQAAYNSTKAAASLAVGNATRLAKQKYNNLQGSKLQESMGETCRLCKQVCKMNGGATRRKRKNKRKTRNSKKY